MKNNFKVPIEHITIGGNPGSGKSTLGTILASELGWVRHDMGQKFRKMADDRKITLKELLKMCDSDPEIDKAADAQQATWAQESKNLVIVGRTSFHFVPQSFKIFLFVGYSIAAARIFEDKQSRNEDIKFSSIDEMSISLMERSRNDKQRYLDLYGVDIYDKANYDLIINTDMLNKNQVVKQTLSAIRVFKV